MKRIEKQAKLERWLADGKSITFAQAVSKWKLYDFRRAINRIRAHFLVDDDWIYPSNGGARYKVYFMRRSK